MIDNVQRDVFVWNVVNQRRLSIIHNSSLILFSTNVIDKSSLVVYMYMAYSFFLDSCVFSYKYIVNLWYRTANFYTSVAFSCQETCGVGKIDDLFLNKLPCQELIKFDGLLSLFSTSALKHEDLSTKNLHLEYFSICITKENLTRKKMPM